VFPEHAGTFMPTCGAFGECALQASLDDFDFILGQVVQFINQLINQKSAVHSGGLGKLDRCISGKDAL
jgi:hypothetical protein